jgi:hypothetical protein
VEIGRRKRRIVDDLFAVVARSIPAAVFKSLLTIKVGREFELPDLPWRTEAYALYRTLFLLKCDDQKYVVDILLYIRLTPLSNQASKAE